MTKQRRRKRYLQQPELTKGFQFNPDWGRGDAAILDLVFDHGMLTAGQLGELLGRGRNAVQSRLTELFHLNYLTKPIEQIPPHQRVGSTPDLYTLGREGARYLVDHYAQNEETDIPFFTKIRWYRQTHEHSQRHIHHTAFCGRMMVAIKEACKKHGHVRYISFREILAGAPEGTRLADNPAAWRVRLSRKRDPRGRYPESFGVEPDPRIFGLHYLEEPEGRNRSFFLPEYDRGTMKITARNLYSSSIHKKLLLYHETYQQGICRERFGLRNFRVLFLTTKGKNRAENMLVANRHQDITGGKGSTMFLFASEQDFLAADDFLSMPWRDGRGDTVRLLD